MVLSVPRLEYKYLVPVGCLLDLRQALLPFMAPDGHLQGGERADYTVRSVYLDTPDLECYREKLEGIALRKKYRIRGYDQVRSDSIVFLEIKDKNCNHISKSRAPMQQRYLSDVLRTGQYASFLPSRENDGLERKSADRFLFYYHRKHLRPVILIVYEREAFFGKFDPSLRVTLDKNVRSISGSIHDFHQGPLRYAFSQSFILEVKFQHSVPPWMQSIIRRFDLQRTSVSKYAICLESHKTYERFPGSSYINSSGW